MAFVDVIFRVNSAAVKTGVESLKNSVRSVKSEIAGSLSGMLATGAIVGTLKSVADEFGRVQDLADRFGTTAESIQRVGFAAAQSGADVEKVAAALTKATKAAADAVDGNAGAAGAFAELGINASEFVNLPLEEKLAVLARGFENVEGAGDRSRLAIEVMGRSGGELLPLLAAGAENLRATMDSATVATNDTVAKMDELGDRLAAAGNTVRVGLGTAFIWAADQVQNFGSYVGATISVILRNLGMVGDAMQQLSDGEFKKAFETISQANDMAKNLGDIQAIAQEEIAAREADRAARNAEKAQRGPVMQPDEAPPEKKAATAEARAVQQEADAAERARLEEERAILGLRQKLADQEFAKLSEEQQLAELINQRNNLMVNRGDNERGMLERQVELNEVNVQIAELMAKREETLKQTAEAVLRGQQEALQGRIDAMQLAGGQSAGQVERGLIGVNYAAIDARAAEQQRLQEQLVALVDKISRKEFTAEIPEAQ